MWPSVPEQNGGPTVRKKEELEELKRSVRILDVLARYGIEVKQQGGKYMALCPFHDDHNPSLSADPIKNVWHCFGCQKGGSAIDFVMLKERITFKEAVNRLLPIGGAGGSGIDP
jgi:DNA primase